MKHGNAPDCVSPDNPDDDTLKTLFREPLAVAVVGLSPKPDRDSHRVAIYLQSQGYRVVPVNPGVKRVLEQPSYPDLQTVPLAVDVVDIFRKVDAIPAIVDAAIAAGTRAVWMQLGLRHPSAARKAREAGLIVVQDRCIKIEHRRLIHRGFDGGETLSNRERQAGSRGRR